MKKQTTLEIEILQDEVLSEKIDKKVNKMIIESEEDIKEGYKQTELGLIPVDWDVKKLEDITNKIGDGLHSTPIYVDKSDYYFINGNNLKNGNIEINSNTKFVSELEFNKYKKDLNEKTILLSINGTIGNVAYYRNEKVVLGKSSAYINCSEKLLSSYLFYFLKSEKSIKYFENELTGTTIRNLSLKSIRNHKILLPEIKEQKKIASILFTWDNAIEKTEKLIETKTKLKKALMQQLLTGKKRFKEFIKSNEYKETELGFIPVDWEVKKLEEVSNIKGGKRLPKGSNLLNIKTSFPYIRVSDMYMGGIDTLNILYVPEDIQPSIKQYTISENDLFISVAGTLGLVGKVPKLLSGANLTENADKITNISINKDFLLYILMSDYIQSEIKNVSTNNAQPKLALTKIRDFLITIPTIEEQKKIASVLTSCDKEIELLEKKLETLKNQKKRFNAKAFNWSNHSEN